MYACKHTHHVATRKTHPSIPSLRKHVQPMHTPITSLDVHSICSAYTAVLAGQKEFTPTTTRTHTTCGPETPCCFSVRAESMKCVPGQKRWVMQCSAASTHSHRRSRTNKEMGETHPFTSPCTDLRSRWSVKDKAAAFIIMLLLGWMIRLKRSQQRAECRPKRPTDRIQIKVQIT